VFEIPERATRLLDISHTLSLLQDLFSVPKYIEKERGKDVTLAYASLPKNGSHALASIAVWTCVDVEQVNDCCVFTQPHHWTGVENGDGRRPVRMESMVLCSIGTVVLSLPLCPETVKEGVIQEEPRRIIRGRRGEKIARYYRVRRIVGLGFKIEAHSVKVVVAQDGIDGLRG
jgi:hypothetical protein